MRLPLSLSGLALCAMAFAAQAQPLPGDAVQPVSTGTLRNLCSTPTTDPNAAIAVGFCRGFMIGVGQYHAGISGPGGARPIFCLPNPTPTLETVQADFVAWAAGNPQYAVEKAVDGLMRFAAAAYPCPTPPPAPPAARRPANR